MLVFNVATCQTSHEKNAQEIVETTDQICAIDIQESFGFLDELTNKSLSLKSTASAYSMRRPADDSAKPTITNQGTSTTTPTGTHYRRSLKGLDGQVSRDEREQRMEELKESIQKARKPDDEQQLILSRGPTTRILKELGL